MTELDKSGLIEGGLRESRPLKAELRTATAGISRKHWRGSGIIIQDEYRALENPSKIAFSVAIR